MLTWSGPPFVMETVTMVTFRSCGFQGSGTVTRDELVYSSRTTVTGWSMLVVVCEDGLVNGVLVFSEKAADFTTVQFPLLDKNAS